MNKHLVETAHISEKAAAAAKSTGRMLVQLISPGWGSSGYYSPQVLEQAAADNVIPAGTHMYADHPTDAEALERPGRSIKDLMAVTREDARLSSDGALVAEVQVVPAWRELVEAVRDDIGVSIRGSATDMTEGEAEGRKGRIIEGLAHVDSVDFVTRAGRGGRVLQVLESAAANQAALDRGVSEATVNDTREQLQTVLRDAHGGDGTYVWVRDFDESTVWFEVDTSGDDTPGGSGLYAQSYSTADSGVSLSGDRTEVRVVTKYVPVNSPATPAIPAGGTTTEESEEDTMPQKTIEEAEYNRLVEADGRVQTLEGERDTEKARADKAESKLAEHDRVGRARELINEHADGVTFTSLEQRGLLAGIPVNEDGSLDEDEFTDTVKTAVAEAKQRAGHGTVSGFGGSASDDNAEAIAEAADDFFHTTQKGA